MVIKSKPERKNVLKDLTEGYKKFQDDWTKIRKKSELWLLRKTQI